MLLEALYQLAERNGLANALDYVYEPVRWLVRIGESGEFLGFESTDMPMLDSKGKARVQIKRFWIPRQPTGRSGKKPKACFLVDNAKFVFGRRVGKAEFSEANGVAFRARFLEIVERCAAETEDAGVIAVAAFLRACQASPGDLNLPGDAEATDLFGFVLEHDECLVHERPAVRAWWLRSREEQPAENAPFRCIVTGLPIEKPALMPMIPKVPGSGGRAALVSFNASAYESWGLSGNENAPLSARAAESCAEALRRLLSEAYPDPQDPGAILPVQSVQLPDETVVAFWSDSNAGDRVAAAVPSLVKRPADNDKGTPQGSVSALFTAGDLGTMPNVCGAFYVLRLRGNMARIVVQDWSTSRVEDVAANVRQYLADVTVPRLTRSATASEFPRLYQILYSLVPPAASRLPIRRGLAGDLVRCVIEGTAFPVDALDAAVRRTLIEWGSKPDGLACARQDARNALIRAALLRDTRARHVSSTGSEAMSQGDAVLHTPAFRRGELFAVLERLQSVAQGSVGASIVDRFFAGAAQTPALAFPGLLTLSRSHARKAKSSILSRGTAAWLESQIDEIVASLPATNAFPDFQSTVQQGEFALGYFSRRYALWQPRGSDDVDAGEDIQIAEDSEFAPSL